MRARLRAPKLVRATESRWLPGWPGRGATVAETWSDGSTQTCPGALRREWVGVGVGACAWVLVCVDVYACVCVK